MITFLLILSSTLCFALGYIASWVITWDKSLLFFMKELEKINDSNSDFQTKLSQNILRLEENLVARQGSYKSRDERFFQKVKENTIPVEPKKKRNVVKRKKEGK